MALQFYLIDTETTGLRSNYQEITELAVINSLNKVQLYRKIKCEYPERASIDALMITGKTLQDLNDGSSRLEAVFEINRFFDLDGLTPAHRVIIGHNIISFDRKFLHALWESVNQKFPADLWLDTLTLTKEFVKRSDLSSLNITRTATGKVSKALHAACDMVGARKPKNKHNAKSDSQANFFLWEKLKEHGIDYLPHIKNMPHILKDDGRLNIDDLDMDIY